MAGLLGQCISAGAIFLLLHKRPETVFVHLNTGLMSHFEREINGESVRIMERKGGVAWKPVASVLRLLNSHVEHRRS